MKWYKLAPVKAILIVLEHVFAMVTVMALVVCWACPELVAERMNKTLAYEDTKAFGYDLQSVSHDIVSCANMLEWPDVIDVVEYDKTEKVIAQNKSGLTFYTEDLLQVADSSTDGEIWVRKKSDGQYVYQTLMQYEKDKREYEDSWITYETVPRNLKTIEGKTLLEIVNTDDRWNGRFNDAQDIINNVANAVMDKRCLYETIKEEYDEGNTNLSYMYVDYENGTVFSNNSKYKDIHHVNSYVEELKEKGKYIVATNRLADFDTNTQLTGDVITELCGEQCLYVIAVDTTYPIQDVIWYKAQDFKELFPIARALLLPGIISLIGFVVGFIWLSCISGRGTKDEEVQVSFIDKIPAEILGALGIGVGILGALLFLSNETISSVGGSLQSYELIESLTLAAFSTLIVCVAFFVVYFSFVRRIKAKIFVETILVVRAWRWCVKIIKSFMIHQKCIVKVLVYYGIYLAVSWIVRIGFVDEYVGVFMAVGAIVDLFVLGKIVQWAISRDALEKGVKQITEGDVEHQINTTGLTTNDALLAEHVNHIGDGFRKAVEQSMKDERLKTELLTNVSHDLKTPLTSIINYVELLKRENIQDEKIQGYINVLEQKAARLKQLTEDVTEASKISSGNITVEYQDLDFVQMICQTTGEFVERFEQKKLQMVTELPNVPVMIRADGRRMWRIIENLYNNVAKYAMEGTRVYATLSVDGDMASFSLKNISEQPLNISAEELTERFIRGDVSRSTEGSGLGLSIAKELTKMQGGEFELYLDGDLFKVTVIFPCKE